MNIDELASLITSLASGRPRLLIGLAGIPGAGKSTMAQALMDRLATQWPGAARLVPMDGFHYSNDHLDQLGLRDCKGSPSTFDVPGYLALLRNIRHDADATTAFPIYDRSLHEPRMTGAPEHLVTPATRVILTEGNYLLLDESPWTELGALLDECWFLDTPVDLARARLIARHQRGGRTALQALQHYERTDAPNTLRVLKGSRAAHRIISETGFTDTAGR